MKRLYLSWQDPDTGRWLPVGRLSYRDKLFQFAYTKGATVSKNFYPFGSMKHLDNLYLSHELFPMFSNRLMSKPRPEYAQFLDWLGLDESEADPFAILSVTGGARQTDSHSRIFIFF